MDLYELAARRNAQVRAIVEGVGWEAQPPGLVLSETAEDAFAILYEGLQRLAGILEETARARGAALPPGGALLDGSSVTPGPTMAGSTRRVGVPGGVGVGAAAGE